MKRSGSVDMHRSSPVIVLIGGGWSAGKSTTAVRVACALGYSNVVHTDVLRASLRVNLTGDDQRVVSLSTYEAAAINQSGEGQECGLGFRRQCELVMPSVISCIDEALEYGKDTVLEGMHLHPSLVVNNPQFEATTFFWLSYPEEIFEQRITQRCATTYRHRDPERYLDASRKRRIAGLNRLLLQDAAECGVRIVDTSKEDPVDVVCRVVSLH